MGVVPDFRTGIVKELKGQRHYLRLWPDPVFLREDSAGNWEEVKNLQDDLDLRQLTSVRDELLARQVTQYPELVRAIQQDQLLLEGCPVPDAMIVPLRVQQQLWKRKTFLAAIPCSFLQRVQRYPERHFRVLQFLARHSEAPTLCDANPMLAFMLATYPLWRPAGAGETEEDVAAVLTWKRRRILAWLGFSSGTNAVLRVMAKVQPYACQSDWIAGLRDTLRNPRLLRRLTFLPRINRGVMALAADQHLLSCVSNSFLQEVAESPEEDRRPLAYHQLQAWQRMNTPAPTAFSVFTSPAQLQRQLLLGNCFTSPADLDPVDLVFPPAPLPDTETIIALRTPEELWLEAMEQGNCVWSLAPQIAAGEIFVYRMLAPERATLSIRRRKGIWTVTEIECALNEPVAEGTRIHVVEWATASGASSCGQEDAVRTTEWLPFMESATADSPSLDCLPQRGNGTQPGVTGAFAERKPL